MSGAPILDTSIQRAHEWPHDIGQPVWTTDVGIKR
jgi:hypothetical protein